MSYYIHKIGTFINDNFLGIDGTETTVQKYSKIAIGIGVAGLAAISWKVTVTAGLLYSAYKGGELAWNRCWPNKKVAAAAANLPEAIENPMAAPLQGGHDAHGDQEEHADEQVLPLIEDEEAVPLIAEEQEEAVPHIEQESDDDRKRRLIAELREQKLATMQCPQARDPYKIGLVYDAVLFHSKIYKEANNPQWLRQKFLRYAKRSKCRLNCMIAYRKMKWKLKETFCCLTQTP